jgi:hypothetical protein
MGDVEKEPPDKSEEFKQMISADAVALARIIQAPADPSHTHNTRGAQAAQKSPVYEFPVIFLEFDEAHPLVAKCVNEKKHSHFSELRRALRMLHKTPVFSLFLSTTGQISQFNPRRAVDPSARVIEGNLQLIPPYSNLGFDQAMKGHEVADGKVDIDEVTSLEFMSQLGRPLYVIMVYETCVIV